MLVFFVMNTRKKLTRKNLAESDDEDGDFSNGSSEEWTPGDENTKNSTTIDSENSSIIPEDGTNLTFDTTTGFSLKILKGYNRSKHPVYSLFGQLLKANKTINRVKDKVFCLKCFNENTFKG